MVSEVLTTEGNRWRIYAVPSRDIQYNSRYIGEYSAELFAAWVFDALLLGNENAGFATKFLDGTAAIQHSMAQFMELAQAFVLGN